MKTNENRRTSVVRGYHVVPEQVWTIPKLIQINTSQMCKMWIHLTCHSVQLDNSYRVTSTRRSKCRIQEGHAANDHTSAIYNEPSLAVRQVKISTPAGLLEEQQDSHLHLALQKNWSKSPKTGSARRLWQEKMGPNWNNVVNPIHGW